MKKLSLSKPYSVDELADELRFDTKLKNGIRMHFGDPVSINDLKQISRSDFLLCKGLGWKSWQQFRNGLNEFCLSDPAVTLIDQPSMDSIIVEIDISKSFREVVTDLARIMEDNDI